MVKLAITLATSIEGDLLNWEILLPTQFELFDVGQCEALYDDGECEREGRVQIMSRDWYNQEQPEIHNFCFECAIAALSEGIWEEVESA